MRIKETALILLFFPFMVSCQSLLSDRHPASHAEKATQIDHHDLKSQADWFYIAGEQKSSQALYDQAISYFKKALLFNPSSFSLRLRLAEEFLRVKRPLQAFKQLQILQAEKPMNKSLRFYLAEIYQSLHLYKKALNEYKEILEQHPGQFKALYQTASLYFLQDEYNKAEEILKDLQDQAAEGDLHKIYYLQAQIHQKKQESNQAFSKLKQAIKQQPHFLPPLLELFSAYSHTHRSQELIAILEEYQDNIDSQPQIQLLLAHLYQQHNYEDKAIELLEFLTEEYPKEWSFHLYLAKMLSQKTGYESQALSLMQKVEEAYPKADPEVYLFYAHLLNQKQDFSEVLKVLQRAKQAFPKNTDILFFNASICYQQGFTRQAVSDLKSILSINNNHIEALNHLAFIYTETDQNIELAEQMAVKALQLAPKDSYILDTAGWTFFKSGKPSLALQYLEQAYKDNTEESLIAAHLAEVYYELNMLDKSIEFYEKAIGLEMDESKKRELQKKLLFIQMDI